jgi:hypothetical protein
VFRVHNQRGEIVQEGEIGLLIRLAPQQAEQEA